MMLSDDLIKKIQRLQLKAGHLVTDALAGEFLSAFRGSGMEFDKVREYIPGDDVRTIDWNVTARMNAPYIKVFREERERTLLLAVDVSGSQDFGTTGFFKKERAAEMAAVLAFMAIKNQDKVGLLIFSDHLEKFVVPGKGRSHIFNIIRTVLTHKSSGVKTDLSQACKQMMRLSKQRSMCFLISDFYDTDYETSMQILSRRHDLTCILMEDPMEQELPNCGLVDLVDAETQQIYSVDMSSAKGQQIYKELSQSRRLELEAKFRKYGIGHFSISTNGTVLDPLLKFIRCREKGIGGGL